MKKFILINIAAGVFFVNGCCFPGDSFVPAKINGRMIDNSGNPVEHEKVIIIVPFIGKEVHQELLTDQKGIFSCSIANSDPGLCCIVPPIGCIPPAREPYFSISVPNISTNNYLIEFPWGSFKYKKMRKSASSQNIKRSSVEKMEMMGVLYEEDCTSYSHDYIIDLEIIVTRNHELTETASVNR